MNIKQTVIFVFIVTIIGFGFKDFCPNYKDINRFKCSFWTHEAFVELLIVANK